MSLNGAPLHIGRRLAALRAQRGLSQGTVARMAKIGPSYLSRLECERAQPTFRMVWRLLVALRGDFEDLLGPEAANSTRISACPISRDGRCLLDLIRSESEVAHAPRGKFVSAHEVRVLHDLADWLESAPSDKVRAVEYLVEALTGRDL